MPLPPPKQKLIIIKSVALRLRGLTDWTRLSPTVSGHGLRHLAPPISFTSRSRPHSPAPVCSYRHLSRGHPALLARSAFLLREPALLTSTQSGPRASQAGLLIQRRRTDDLRFEAPLRIVEYPDPILRARNKRVDLFDDNLKKLVEEMFDVMYKTDGIGLSAPQVGINVQLMVFNPVGERGEGEEIVLVNPRVNRYSKKMVLFNEGCLSFPQIYADVEIVVGVPQQKLIWTFKLSVDACLKFLFLEAIETRICED
ncbi:peptide deformylase 1B, chloroplastic isoform X3 [Alnus glutinosa]|uniref:peptide deformylase 1B, chloroplastic isoform X3 n=1 Tax=Alnus glutinosa TaxID=3517 RepID=UPI002D768DEC|nr:peptide deformylase 1B, chloroplastic isoform X3 [Alnus glutinosa]